MAESINEVHSVPQQFAKNKIDLVEIGIGTVFTLAASTYAAYTGDVMPCISAGILAALTIGTIHSCVASGKCSGNNDTPKLS